MQLPHLPLFRTSDDALALTVHHQDPFFLAAFSLQDWVCGLLTQAMNEYADHPDPAARSMQTGQAWRAFQPVFGQVCDEDFHTVVNYLARFALCESPVCQQLRRALLLVYSEHDLSGDFLAPRPVGPSPNLRRSVERLCDWLDAVVQINTHILWAREPACFDPDPEKRRLATDRLIEPCIAEMNEPAVVTPYLPPRNRSNHAKPAATSSVPPVVARPWPYPRFDEAVISVWPLLTLHNWTYADLWNLLSHVGGQVAPAPCPNPRHLAHYCLHTLGLRKSGHGQTTRNSLPPGHQVALRFLRRTSHRSPPLGRGPWS
jgi:hypothetical protein